MKTKIKSVTIVNQQGSAAYHIGNVYNGLLLDHITDRSQEFPDSTEFVYRGFTAEDALVFEVINCPVDVEYVEDKEVRND